MTRYIRSESTDHYATWPQFNITALYFIKKIKCFSLNKKQFNIYGLLNADEIVVLLLKWITLVDDKDEGRKIVQ